MILQKKWYILVIVILFITISMFVILGSIWIFNSFLNNDELRNLQIEANIELDNQYKFFKQSLIFTNSDWLGYLPDLPDKRDINNDDDDFNWLENDIDWIKDNDWDAFKYKIWVIPWFAKKNIILLDQSYQNYVDFNYFTLTWFLIYSDKSAQYEFKVYDWDEFIQSNLLLEKINNKWIISPGENNINITLSDIKINDIISINLENSTDENLSYKIKWIKNNWTEINYFLPIVQNGRNFDLYTSTLIIDKSWSKKIYYKIYEDVLEWWKIPIAPSYLKWYWSGSEIYLDWEINDIANTWSYYLFRWKDNNVNCSEEYFLSKISDWYKNNSFSGNYNLDW